MNSLPDTHEMFIYFFFSELTPEKKNLFKFKDSLASLPTPAQGSSELTITGCKQNEVWLNNSVFFFKDY